MVALAVIGVGAAFAYMGVLNGKLSKGIDEDTQLALTDKSLAEPFYMLLMGTDKSQERDASGEYGDSYRSDSTMLARIDPVQKKVTLISIERDTLVNIEGYMLKINWLILHGGVSYGENWSRNLPVCLFPIMPKSTSMASNLWSMRLAGSM